jgi:hypothetical protein
MLVANLAVFAATALQSATGIGFGIIAGPILLVVLNDNSAASPPSHSSMPSSRSPKLPNLSTIPSVPGNVNGPAIVPPGRNPQMAAARTTNSSGRIQAL